MKFIRNQFETTLKWKLILSPGRIILENRINELEKQIENHEQRIQELETLVRTEKSQIRRGSYSSGKEIIEAFKSLDLSEYGEIFDLSGLALFLAILRVSRDELGIDGLTPPEISKIYKEKIRISKGVARTTISNALTDARGKVDRIDNPRGQGYAYMLMKEGELIIQQEIHKNEESN